MIADLRTYYQVGAEREVAAMVPVKHTSFSFVTVEVSTGEGPVLD